MRYSAAFLDRDGTVIDDAGYVDDPADVRLIPRAAEAIGRLNARRIPVIVITNQSGIGRGLYDEADFEAVQSEVERRLAVHGCALDGVYFCPHDPEREPPCECRKPGMGLHREAAERFGIDLEDALYVGDKLSDVLPAREAGATGFLVRTGQPIPPDAEIPPGCRLADDLWEAVDLALASS